MLYTLQRMMVQQAVLERDVSEPDAYGADSAPDWRPLNTVPCLLWWDRSSGARSANRSYVSTSRQVAVSQGGIMLPAGTDVTEQDRIVQINKFDPAVDQWVLDVVGLFTIVAVLNQQDHVELSVTRPNLGA